MVAIWQMIYGVVVGCEILVMLQMSGPPLQKNDTLYESLCLTPLDKAHVLLETPCVFWIIMCLMFGGGILRLWCYSTMGRFFTFELTMSSDHYLVTTGPYSFIRHPSYTAAIMLIMGSLTEFFAWSAYPSACDLVTTYYASPLYFCIAMAVFSVASLYQRTFVEDRQLRERFSKDWVAYSRQVPYKLVPYVF